MTNIPDSSNPFPENVDQVFTHCRVATMAKGNYGIMENAALAVSGKTIAWVGPMDALPETFETIQVTDCRNHWILPGFVDCHTHLVWAGSRAREFEMRLAGVSYAEIAKAGGGIVSTVKATRAAAEDTLFDLASRRMSHLLTQGITTVEIKSGYGLDLESELKMLAVAGRLNKACPQHVTATFLGAHAIPLEFSGRADAYIKEVIEVMLPRVKAQGIATAVDAFCETIAFFREQIRQVFEKAKDLGFAVKLHAEQLSDSGGTALAAEMGALSCDHLEYLSVDGAEKMAEHGTVAVLLPGAFYYLKETKVPPVAVFRQLDIPMAVATDLNPGSSPVLSMTPVLNMACLLFGLTCEEALAGATLHGAAALGLADCKGSLEPGKDADFVIWDVDTPADLCYLTGITPLKQVVIQGKTAYPQG
ncbi:MAG: imidazolonepropionase [Desulfotignum sp.]|nr:imidazolonepropionase [Desulfotignum sp.]MCF8125966.1 imidazolonepropionase [Desulfotignum sp.]